MLEAILNDTQLTDVEKESLKKFADEAARLAASGEVDVTDFAAGTWTMDVLVQTTDIPLRAYAKESLFSVALWVLFYATTREHYPPEKLKFQRVDAFLDAYGGYFNAMDPIVQEQLKDEANWFNVANALLPPQSNKGLAIQVVPRLIEGWHAKYVTGSGQTQATADRVLIFQTEGQVRPSHRGGGVSSKSKTPKSARRKKRFTFPVIPGAPDANDPRPHKKPRPDRPPSTAAAGWTSGAARVDPVVTRHGSHGSRDGGCPDGVDTPGVVGLAAAANDPYAFPMTTDYPDDTDAEFDEVSVASDSGDCVPNAAAGAAAANSNSSSSGGGYGGLAGFQPLRGIGSKFQPLFDFTQLGGPLCPVPGTDGDSSRLDLRRFVSWDDTVCGGGAAAPAARCTTPIKDFLFDAFLQTTADAVAAPEAAPAAAGPDAAAAAAAADAAPAGGDDATAASGPEAPAADERTAAPADEPEATTSAPAAVSASADVAQPATMQITVN